MHLIIAEKHIAAKRIASILAPKKPKKVRVSGMDTFEYEQEDQRTVIMGLSGHIVQLDFAKAYNNWQKVDAKELINADIITAPSNVKIVSALKKLGKQAGKVTIATDYDREGELIGVEALKIIQDINPDIKFQRVLYSSITKASIEEAFALPAKVDFNLADAGHSRQVIDLVWGASLTRYLSLSAGRLGKLFLSVGRVQSPTLALIVDKEKERQAFISKPYWEIYTDLKDEDGNCFKAQHKTAKFWEKAEAEEVMKIIGDRAQVTSVVRKDKTDKPPTPFNTTDFISAASSIGFSAANSMRIAESLYTNGYISYPRTDNTVYPATLDLRAQIEVFTKGTFKAYAEKLLEKDQLTPTRGKKETTDHPPIYPASLAKKSDLNEQEWKLYELVVRRFFATFAEEARWETLRVRFNVNGEEFRASGARLVHQGWRWYYPYNAPEDRLLPDLTEGDILSIMDSEMLDKETQPPGRYGQGRLIRIMEEQGLGTKATRHDIISKLYSRAYVHGNPLQPTKTAFAVVEALEEYAPTITKHDMTSKLEEDMDQIAEGQIAEENVLDESRKMLEDIFSELEDNSEKLSESLRAGLREDKVIGTCPECGEKLMVRRSKRGGRFIGCNGYPDCTFSLPLPKSGQVIVTDKICDEHGLFHIKIVNQKKRPWELGCPHCNFLEWKKTQEEEKAKEPKLPRPKTLEDIPGIGKVTAEKLISSGIKTVEDLEKANPLELSRDTNLSQGKIIKWQELITE